MDSVLFGRCFLKSLSLALLLLGSSLAAQQLRLTLDAGKAGGIVSPLLYGLMIEEINHSIDGGLYAEMVQNRAFHKDWSGTTPWDLIRRGSSQGTRDLDLTYCPSQSLSSSMKLAVTSASSGNEVGLTNPGYWGYGLRPNTTYSGSLYAHVNGDSPGPISIRVIGNRTGTVQASATVTPQPGAWAQYHYTLGTANIAPSTDNHLELTVAHPGTVSLQLVSLFQPTYHDRANGLRPDLMQMMGALHPAFLRLPGGNFLKGNTLADA
jgi:alpha-N-arabinofuranosidase